jgi:hypothetical protein
MGIEVGGSQTGQARSNQKRRFDPGLTAKKANPERGTCGLTPRVVLDGMKAAEAMTIELRLDKLCRGKTNAAEASTCGILL